MKAVILAAGEGQRLRPFTVSKPKVMIKVGNKPILQYVVEALRDSGIMDIVMVVGYRKDRVMSHFGDGKRFGVRVEYAFQEQQLGTAHALKQAENLVSDEF
ncbi:MAG: NTP transferase domain-containing protein, partial [Archaeoglobi archaeon]|nr:NTP transferase domain-containing protein [Archaeoglobi archaeon]